MPSAVDRLCDGLQLSGMIKFGWDFFHQGSNGNKKQGKKQK